MNFGLQLLYILVVMTFLLSLYSINKVDFTGFSIVALGRTSVSCRLPQIEAGPRTIKPHDVLQRVQVRDVSLVTAEDLGSGTEVIGEVLSVLLPHFPVTTQGVNLWVEGDIVGRPVTYSTNMEPEEKFFK